MEYATCFAFSHSAQVRFETTAGTFEVEVNRSLAPLGADHFHKLVVKLEAERVTDERARELGQIMKASPGKCKVVFNLKSREENIMIEAPSKAFNVAVTEQLVRALDSLTDVEVSVG